MAGQPGPRAGGLVGPAVVQDVRQVILYPGQPHDAAQSRAFDAAAFAKRTVDEWMASQEHHDNIVSPDFTTTGIGVVVIRDRAYATQIFRGPPPPAQR